MSKDARQVIGNAIGRQYADTVIAALDAGGFAIVPKELTAEHFRRAYVLACGDETTTSMAILDLKQAQMLHSAIIATASTRLDAEVRIGDVNKTETM
jgi:hypothetical protein